MAIARDGEIIFEDVSVARLTMRQMTEAELSAYLDTAGDAVTTSVGGYQLESLILFWDNPILGSADYVRLIEILRNAASRRHAPAGLGQEARTAAIVHSPNARAASGA